MSFKELCFYGNIPKRFRKKEEDHSLSIQKNVITNEFEVIKRYNRDLPKSVFKNFKGFDKIHFLKLLQLILKGDKSIKQFIMDCEKAVYKSRDLWDAIKKAEGIYKIYYKNDKEMVEYKRCLHHESEKAPLCIVKN